MSKLDQEERDASSAFLLSETDIAPILESPEDAFILYLCEEPEIAKREVVPVLKEAGYELRVAKARMGKSPSLLNSRCWLVLLDIGELDAEGYQVCAQIRSISQLPIMLILRGAARLDVLRCFEAGADTFVLAPFRTREFLARLNALLRRTPWRRELWLHGMASQ
jgi:DNA-binding response OmpR family regulator